MVYLLLVDVRLQALDLTAMRLARRRRSVFDVLALGGAAGVRCRGRAS
jgi:hypothetical protein